MVVKIQGVENLSLWQRLNFFPIAATISLALELVQLFCVLHRIDISINAWSRDSQHKIDISINAWSRDCQHKIDISINAWSRDSQHKIDISINTWSRDSQHKSFDFKTILEIDHL